MTNPGEQVLIVTSPVASWAIEQPCLPRYEILRQIGEGMLANVFEVRAARDGSIHALKALKPEHAASGRVLARFADEYRILSSLRFPCLPEVSDYGVTPNGTRFMVMDAVKGEALDDYLRAHPDDLWILVFQLVETLAFVHEHDLLHLDLKPGNVLVKRGRFGGMKTPAVVLIDFGLSYRRDVGGEAKLIGTTDYMAPEIIRGDESPTRAADYYSLGCVLFELIEGRPPFEGTGYEKLQAHLKNPVRFQSKKVEHAELYPWIEKLMAKDPMGRLDAFQGFREAIAARLGERVEPFNRAFALGYVDSLGVIGKHDLRQKVAGWIESVHRAIRSGRSAGGDRVRAAESRRGSLDPEADLAKQIKQDLLSEAVEDTPVDPVNRMLVLSGPPDSGTTHLIASIGHDLRIAGTKVATLGAGGDWPDLTRSRGSRSGRARAVDPGSVAVDRFVRAWDRLSECASDGPVALLVENMRGLSKEEQEFADYAIRRIGLALSEGQEPGVFAVIGANASELAGFFKHDIDENTSTVLSVPPPGTEEIESIVESFRGHLAGVDAARNLEATLEKNLHGTGAMVMALRRAVIDRHLKFENGTWSLPVQPSAPSTADAAGAAYYRHLLDDLPENARRLVEWVCAHPAALSVEEMTVLSQLEPEVVREGLGATQPHRIISVESVGRTDKLRIASADIRRHLYELVEPSTRRRIHERFAAVLGERELDSPESLQTLAFHYERLGRVRDALLTRMRAIVAAREATHIFAVRELCETSIEYLNAVGDPEWKPRRPHLRNRFIKWWIDSEWSVGNYGGLANILKRYFPDIEGLPLGFAYKYATSLERAGRVDDSIAVIEHAKRRLGDPRSETYNNILVHHASLLHGIGAHQQAIEILDNVDTDRLKPSVRPRYYISYAIAHRALGRSEESRRYLDMTVKASTEMDDTDILLRAQHYRLETLLNESAYSEMTRELRSAIRFASQRKAYRSLHALYFLASGAYHEQGDFRKAILYLRKSVRAAVDIGFTELHQITNRFALNYLGMGAYGDALDAARRAVAATPRTDAWTEGYFFTQCVLFEVLNNLNAPDAERCAGELQELLSKVGTKFRRAYFHRLFADHQAISGAHEAAIEEYKKARDLYQQVGFADDEARTRIGLARAYLESGNSGAALKTIRGLEKDVGLLESADIEADYQALALSAATTNERVEAIRSQIETCEAVRSRIHDVNVGLRLDAALFHAYRSMNDKKALGAFRRYYDRTKAISANLRAPERIEDFTRRPEFVEMVERFRELQSENPGQEGD